MPEDEAFVLNHIIECLTCVEYILGKPIILLLRFLRPSTPIKQEHESLLEDETRRRARGARWSSEARGRG